RARERRNRILHKLPNHLVLTFSRITEPNLDRDLIAVDAHALHRFAGDEVLPGIGIDHALKGRRDVGVGQRHRKLREIRANKLIGIATILSEPWRTALMLHFALLLFVVSPWFSQGFFWNYRPLPPAR